MMKGVIFLAGVFLFLSEGYSQYYSPTQINNIQAGKLAGEGDMYLDTINYHFYLGLTNGSLAKINENTTQINQVSHGFSTTNLGVLPLKYNHTTSNYDLAQADSLINFCDILMVKSVNANSFLIQDKGYAHVVHGLPIGYWYYLDTVAGQIIREDSISLDKLQQRLFFTLTANKININIDIIGSGIGSGSGGDANCTSPSITSIQNDVIFIDSSNSNKDTLFITGTDFRSSTVFSISPSNNVTIDGYRMLGGTSAEVYLTVDTSLGFPVQTEKYSISVNTGACLGNDKEIIVNRDIIRSSLTVSGPAYDTTGDNGWIQITPAEYNNLLINVRGVQTAGPDMTIAATNRYTTNILLVPNSGSTAAPPNIPANSYMFALAIRSSGTSLSTLNPDLTQDELAFSSVRNSGYTKYGTIGIMLDSVQLNTMYYFVMKRPTVSVGPTAGYYGYYNKHEFVGSRPYLTSTEYKTQYVINASASYSSILPGSHTQQALIQVLTTTDKQW